MKKPLVLLSMAAIFSANAFAFNNAGAQLGLANDNDLDLYAYYKHYNVKDFAYALEFEYKDRKIWTYKHDLMRLGAMIGKSFNLSNNKQKTGPFINALVGASIVKEKVYIASHTGIGLKAGLNFYQYLPNNFALYADGFLNLDLHDGSDFFATIDVGAKYNFTKEFYADIKLTYDSKDLDSTGLFIGAGYSF